MNSNKENKENKIENMIKTRTGEEEGESRFISFESCCSDQELLDTYFNNLASEDPNVVIDALKELILICKQEPINISVEQFYSLLHVFTVLYTKDAEGNDIDINFIPNLALSLINQIVAFPESLIETFVTNDFIAPLLPCLPNHYLFVVLGNFAQKRKGIAEYINDYGVIDIIDPLLKSENQYTDSCLYLLRRLADMQIVKEEYMPLFYSIINETENEDLRRKSFKTLSSYIQNSENCRNYFIQNIDSFMEYIDAFPMNMKGIFLCFTSFLECKDEEKILDLLSSDEIQLTQKIIGIISSPESINLFGIFNFLTQASKYDLIKAFILDNTELLSAIIDIASNQSSYDFKTIKELFKLIGRILTFNSLDVASVLQNGLFQIIIDFIPFSKGGSLIAILKAIINIIQVAQSQSDELVTSIHENDSLAENVETVYNSTSHKTTKRLSQTIIEFMTSSMDA